MQPAVSGLLLRPLLERINLHKCICLLETSENFGKQCDFGNWLVVSGVHPPQQEVDRYLQEAPCDNIVSAVSGQKKPLFWHGLCCCVYSLVERNSANNQTTLEYFKTKTNINAFCEIPMPKMIQWGHLPTSRYVLFYYSNIMPVLMRL